MNLTVIGWAIIHKKQRKNPLQNSLACTVEKRPLYVWGITATGVQFTPLQ